MNRPKPRSRTALLALLGGLVGLSGAVHGEPASAEREALSQPIANLPESVREGFFRGRSLFRQNWVVAPSRDNEVDGLGPLYNRLACLSCHAKNGRGGAPERPEQRMQSMLVRLSVPGQDAHGGPKPHPAYGDQLNEEGVPGVRGEGRASLSWQTLRLKFADGESIELRLPQVRYVDLAYSPLKGALTSLRVSPHVAGLGLLEGVPAETLEKLAAEAKPDGVKGQVNHVWDRQAQRTVVGRFGLKANAPNLRQQIAGAFVGDLGITSDLFREENCTPAQTACREAASGGSPELKTAQLDAVETYLAYLAPPPRRNREQPAVQQGEAVFAASGCALCHRPSLPGGDNPRFPALSGLPVEAYTDLLLHDMGAALADGRPDYQASGRQWRTAPLWGLGLVQVINEDARFLHDGRARTVEEAILWHGGEAETAKQRYLMASKAEREALKAFLLSL